MFLITFYLKQFLQSKTLISVTKTFFDSKLTYFNKSMDSYQCLKIIYVAKEFK